MSTYILYILYSPSYIKTYVGQTENLKKRLKEHNVGKVRSTRAFTPWEIMYVEECESREKALAREKYYKSYAGRQKIKTILGTKKSQVRSPRSAEKAI
jgi:putative endonuclease